MYSRRLNDQTFTFEPSGGLLNASLVMMDRETDSHWSIITEEAVWGQAKGTKMETLPGSVKTTWASWRALHPMTLVLSINDKEHEPKDHYAEYFASDEGFFEMKAKDGQLADKAHIYAFHWDDGTYAVAHPGFFGGGVVRLGDRQVFLYRIAEDSSYQSTSAFIAPPGIDFEASGGSWSIGASSWNPETRLFEGADAPEAFTGFDTFWYVWSLTNGGTQVLQTS